MQRIQQMQRMRRMQWMQCEQTKVSFYFCFEQVAYPAIVSSRVVYLESKSENKCACLYVPDQKRLCLVKVT